MAVASTDVSVTIRHDTNAMMYMRPAPNCHGVKANSTKRNTKMRRERHCSGMHE